MGNFRIPDMPRLKGYEENGRTVACYLGLLGLCNFDDTTCFNKYVDEKDLTADFVKRFVAKIKPCLEKFLKSGGRADQSGRPTTP